MFLRSSWKQGEHVSLCGPTGCGKTTLSLQLLPIRDYVVAFATKPKDSTFANLQGYRKLSEFNPRPGEKRIILWPPFNEPADQVRQRDVFRDAFNIAFTQGGWTVFVDEARYFIDTLKLGAYLKTYWGQGRSLGLTLITGTQRPAYMPLEFYDQATHLFIWKDNDRINVSRLAGLAGSEKLETIKATIPTLARHEFVYINTRTDDVFRSMAPKGG